MDNTFFDQSMKTARECGSYKAIAGMMAERIRQLETAEAGVLHKCKRVCCKRNTILNTA